MGDWASIGAGGLAWLLAYLLVRWWHTRDRIGAESHNDVNGVGSGDDRGRNLERAHTRPSGSASMRDEGGLPLRVVKGNSASTTAGDEVECANPHCLRCVFWKQPAARAAEFQRRIDAAAASRQLSDTQNDLLARLSAVFSLMAAGNRLAFDVQQLKEPHGALPDPTCVLVPLPELITEPRPFWELNVISLLSNLGRPGGAADVFQFKVASIQEHVAAIEQEFLDVWNLQSEANDTAVAGGGAALKGEDVFRLKEPFGLIEESQSGARWSSFELWNQGKVNMINADMCPRTAEFLRIHAPRFMGRGLADPEDPGCQFGHAFFSVMEPGVEIKPHHGPVNFRVRIHVPLFSPPSACSITVGGEERQWFKGSVLVLDDSFEHSVQFKALTSNLGGSLECRRVILLFDVWHPLLTDEHIWCLQQAFGANGGVASSTDEKISKHLKAE